MPTPLEDYLFDLRGYLILEGAVSPEQVCRINQAIDAIPPLRPGEWFGYVQRQSYHEVDGINLQNIVEGGEAFEELIDHPAWIEHVRHYVGHDEGLFIDECFVNLRGPGGGIYMHSGGHHPRLRTLFGYHDGHFYCGQINILLALTDIGPGDGATTLIPGSHKSNLRHPDVNWPVLDQTHAPAPRVEGAIEIYLKAGDVLLFVDSLCHGGLERINPGERRILVYRYGPRWGKTRFGYQPSEELLARLTPERRQIIQPIPPRRPPLYSEREKNNHG